MGALSEKPHCLSIFLDILKVLLKKSHLKVRTEKEALTAFWSSFGALFPSSEIFLAPFLLHLSSTQLFPEVAEVSLKLSACPLNSLLLLMLPFNWSYIMSKLVFESSFICSGHHHCIQKGNK